MRFGLISAGEDVMIVRKEVAEIVQGRIIVGHAIHNDLKVHLVYFFFSGEFNVSKESKNENAYVKTHRK